MSESRRWLKRLLAPTEIVLAALYRLIPAALRPPNLAPVGALGIYGGARLPLWQALTMPLLVMILSDLLLWHFYHFKPFDIFVYASFMVYVLLGRLARNSRSRGRLALLALIGSIQFYIITNFGFWYDYDPEHSWSGLVKAYIAGLLFLPWTMGGDLIFTGMLVGVHDWVEKHVTEQEEVPAELPAEPIPADTETAHRPEESPA
jgi:hypothetical protein